MPVSNPPGLTRRQLGAALVVSSVLQAQTPAPPQAAAMLPIPANPEEELTAARAQIQQNAAALAKFDLHMTTEPACHFKA